MNSNCERIVSGDIPPEADFQHQVSCTVEKSSIAQAGSRCPICGSTVTDAEEVQICQDCHTPHHKDCWEYTGGCAIFGCHKVTICPRSGVANPNKVLSLKNIRRYCTIFRVQGYVLVFASYSFLVSIAGITILIISMIAYPALSVPCSFTPSWFVLIEYLVLVTGLATGVGVVGYIILIPPTLLLRKMFEEQKILGTSESSKEASRIAERIDISDLTRYTSPIYIVLSKSLEIIIALVLIQFLREILVGGTAFYSGQFLNALLILGFVRFKIFPVLAKTIEERSTLITSYQNRLIASAKKGK